LPRTYDREADRALKAEITESQAAERLRLGTNDLGRRGAVPASSGRMVKETTTRTNRTVINILVVIVRDGSSLEPVLKGALVDLTGDEREG